MTIDEAVEAIKRLDPEVEVRKVDSGFHVKLPGSMFAPRVTEASIVCIAKQYLAGRRRGQ